MIIAQQACDVVELRKTATGTILVGLRLVGSADGSALSPAPTPAAQQYIEVEEAGAPALGARIDVTYTEVTIV